MLITCSSWARVMGFGKVSEKKNVSKILRDLEFRKRAREDLQFGPRTKSPEAL